jgi:hypothetical protein
MSNALGRLRDYFDDELLVQIGRKMELTQRAEVLREAVQDVLLRIDTTITAQPKFEPAKSDRVFRICVSDYSMVTLIPNMLALAQSQASAVKFQLRFPRWASRIGRWNAAMQTCWWFPTHFARPTIPRTFFSRNHFVVWFGVAVASQSPASSTQKSMLKPVM